MLLVVKCDCENVNLALHRLPLSLLFFPDLCCVYKSKQASGSSDAKSITPENPVVFRPAGDSRVSVLLALGPAPWERRHSVHALPSHCGSVSPHSAGKPLSFSWCLRY